MEAFIYDYIFRYLNPESQQGLVVIIILSTWSLIWKALGFWKSARNNERLWFLAFIVFQTIGILEILYLFAFSKDKLTVNKIQSNIKSYKINNPLRSLRKYFNFL